MDLVFKREEDAIRLVYDSLAYKFDASIDASIVKVLEGLGERRVNAAIMLHVGNRSEKEVIAYLTDILVEDRGPV